MQASENQTGGVEIFPGCQVYPFSFQLPASIPPTYKGRWGSVEYVVTATVDIPWGINIVQQKEIKVKLPYNLNTQSNRHCASPCVIEKRKLFCCWCCTSDPFNITVTVPVTGYIPGQSIPLTIECENRSDVDIEKIDIRLVRNVEFTTHTPYQKTRIEENLIAAEVIGPLLEGKTLTCTKYLDIPADIVPYMDHCNLIKFDYKIKMETLPSGCHLAFERKIPIVMGTVPLHSFKQISSPVKPSDVNLDVGRPQSSNIGWNVGLNNEREPNTSNLGPPPPYPIDDPIGMPPSPVFSKK